MNPMQKMQQLNQVIKGMKDPQQTVLQLLETSNNPMAKNVLEMAKKGDSNGIEQFARNISKERGFDFDETMKSLRSMFNR